MNAYTLKSILPTRKYNTEITRATFDASFMTTDEKVTFTFHGWDGKSYDGESRTSRVYRSRVPGFEGIRFVKVGKAVHSINEGRMVTEKATGKAHPTAEWLVDVARVPGGGKVPYDEFSAALHTVWENAAKWLVENGTVTFDQTRDNGQTSAHIVDVALGGNEYRIAEIDGAVCGIERF